MGVETTAWVRYGCVFDRHVIEEVVRAQANDSDDEDDDFVQAASSLFESADIEVEDSTDLYSGDDYDKQVFIFLTTYGCTVSGKGMSRCTVMPDDEFHLKKRDIKKFDTQLNKVGLLGRELERGWLMRSFMS